MKSASERYGAVIHAYCQMSNHYHLLLETPGGNLSQIMRHINGAYTTYFNVKRKRAGHLFQGRFKAILVEADEYAKELSRYIHLNPVRVGLVATPEEYEWSSYRHYIGQTETPTWLKTSFILGYFDDTTGGEKYQEFVHDSMKTGSESPLKGAVTATVLGSSEFVKRVTQDFLGEMRTDRNVPAIRELASRTLDEIVAIVGKLIGKDKNMARKVSIYFCHRYSGARLRVVGECFGMSDAAITQASKRIRIAAADDENVKRMLGQVSKELGIVPS